MPQVCPTVLARTPEEFEKQVDRIAPFAERVQIDLSDGIFTKEKTINPIQVWWPQDWTVDLHLMIQQPAAHIETLVSIKPSLVIVHAEADGDIGQLLQHLKKFDIRTGVALLPETTVDSVKDIVSEVDHVLIFGGSLGSFGGAADLSQLEKIAQIKDLNPAAELGWDGGANVENIEQLLEAGIDVVNVGSAIQKADDSEKAYATLVAKL